MTKTEATRKAKRQLSYGHYTRSAVEHYVRCPDCRREVPASTLAWEKGAAIERALLRSLVTHLIEPGQCDQAWA
jgi:hypothetical protein